MTRNIAIGIILVFSLPAQRIYSAHIIGGEMYYDCLGYGKDTTFRRYLITIKLYRDCAGGGAYFDQPLGFTIYRQSGNQYINTKTGTGSAQEYSIPLLTSVKKIDPPQYPCLELPDNICGEAGVYEVMVELPIINEKYVVVWQRCCRNKGITNIIDPGNTGATYSIEIHPESQRTCNSSPRFINFPPTVLCVNAPFKFDHSAVDKEGDLLVYEFCEPLKGGGPDQLDFTSCNGVTPRPDCPPPFDPVDYEFPYSALFPLGGNPPITINSFDGLISGTPTAIGKFVVSVCVSEYRNGILLSKLKRDFQFNIAHCDGEIEARLEGANKLNTDHFEITLCGTKNYQIVNTSIDSKYIHDIQWTYENGGMIDTFYGWSPFIQFKEGGVHSGQFIINPNTNCGDTGYFKINIIPDLNSQFTAVYDSCKAGSVKFMDQSSSSNSTIKNWSWSLGDGFYSYIQNPELQYLRPGTYPVLLTVKDNYGCISKINRDIQWYPAPDVVVFRPNVNEGCVPLKVEFKNVSFPTDNTYRFIWKFSDGVRDSGFTVQHEFNVKGSYDLKLEVESPLGCYTEGEFKDVIFAYDPPTANWSVDSTMVNLKNPVIHVRDQSAGTIGRTWIIDDKNYFYDPELQVVLADTGIHHIRMIAMDRFLCTDTLDTDVIVYQDFSLFMPNAFTPNGDGLNDEFGPVGQMHSIEKYQLTIYDRWGSKVFESEDPKQLWNGSFDNTGPNMPPGIYVYDLYYKATRKDPYHEQKMLTLIK
jgi:gliding motility-associated-like protein